MVETYVTIDGWQWYFDTATPYRLDKATKIVGEGGEHVIIPRSLVNGVAMTEMSSSTFSDYNLGKAGFTSIVIHGGISTIPKSAFKYHYNLTSVVMEEGVEKIDESSFDGCIYLTSIIIPNTLKRIELKGLNGLTRLTNIELPDSIEFMGRFSMSNCKAITSIRIPNGVTVIEDHSFYGCHYLTSIIFPPNLTKIGRSAFSGCNSLVNIDIPEGVTEIGKSAFSADNATNAPVPSLKTVTFPSTVTSLGDYMFQFCTALEHLNFKMLNKPTFTSLFMTDAPMSCLCHAYATSNFPAPGQYLVGATKMGDYLIPPDPPVAQFEASITYGAVPLTVQFTDTSINSPTAWHWDFGDGGTSTKQTPEHTYTLPGTYTVTLSVTSPGGTDSKTIADLIQTGSVPEVSFSSTESYGPVPHTVLFSDTSINAPTSWLWNFGDGTTNTEQNPTHTYTDSGLFTVTLTASNQFGSDTMTKPEYIEAIDPAWIPTAAFTASETEGVVPFVVTFNDTTTGKAPLDYSWTFGDGSSSTEQHPVHVYDAPGVYTVSLTVSNQYGNSSTTGSITVYLKPKADFIISSYSGEVPLTVQFTDKSINATTWHWDFGDGVTSEEQHPTHVYWTVGEYIVSLTISSIWGSDVRRAKESIVVGDFYKDIFIESHMGMNHRRSEVSDIKPITANENEATRLVVTFPKEMHGFEKHVIISYINSTGKKATTSILMDYSDKLEAYVFVLSNEYLYGKEVRIQFQCVPTDNKNIQTFMDPQILRFIIKESLRGKPPQTSS